MAVKIVRICDVCGASTTLQVSETGRHADIQSAALDEGWASLNNNRHICPNCIKDVLDAS